MVEPAAPARLGILLLSGTHERAHYAFVMASAAAALGRAVVIFATNHGCRALLPNCCGLADAEREARVTGQGVAGLVELREACVALGVKFLACEAGLRIEGIAPEQLLPWVQVAGVATFLEASRGGQILTL